MPRLQFIQIDVFTSKPFGGNQLAVFLDGEGLTAGQMQTLAWEMNYSECTFLLPPERPGSAARVRIFAPSGEMPMAGHPTVGTALVLLNKGRLSGNQATLDLKIGPIQIDFDESFVWMSLENYCPLNTMQSIV
jgi:trans-2,3-dihydro-3-hydroxyanthranilate isomerase